MTTLANAVSNPQLRAPLSYTVLYVIKLSNLQLSKLSNLQSEFAEEQMLLILLAILTPLDVVSRRAAAYSADHTFADDKRTKQWSYTENLCWDKELFVVPDNKEVKQLIFHEFHDSADQWKFAKLSRTYCISLHGLTSGLKLILTSDTVIAVKKTTAATPSLRVRCSPMLCLLALGVLS